MGYLDDVRGKLVEHLPMWTNSRIEEVAQAIADLDRWTKVEEKLFNAVENSRWILLINKTQPWVRWHIIFTTGKL